jgi:nicotinate-nucleotide--dimethylbenzimidazole phosphoribosyltransferase
MHSFKISAPDRAIENSLKNKVDRKTKPLGALGQLESVAKKVALIQQTLTPALRQPQMLVFAADHGAAKAGVSAYPQDVTWQMVGNFLNGGAAINVFCRQSGIALSVVDAGVAHDFAAVDAGFSAFIDAKIAHGTANYLEQPAMSTAQCAEAIARGAAIVRELAAQGCNVVGFGEMGIGNTASASLITHCLTGTPLAECVGRGTGLDDAGLARKQALLEQALARYRATGGGNAPLAVLAEFGGFEIAMMTGAMLAAAEAGMVLLIDGFIVGSAALTAARLHPALLEYCIFCHRSAEAGHRAQLQALQAEPLLDLGLRLGEGTGAALAWPLVQASVAFLNEMASFESAGVADQDAAQQASKAAC